jgi:hypothetical protein
MVCAVLALLVPVTFISYWRSSARLPADSVALSRLPQRTVTLRLAVPGSAGATLVLIDGSRSTLALPGQPPIQLGARILADSIVLDVIGPDSAGVTGVLFTSQMRPGSRVRVKRPYPFDLEWPVSEPTTPTQTVAPQQALPAAHSQ